MFIQPVSHWPPDLYLPNNFLNNTPLDSHRKLKISISHTELNFPRTLWPPHLSRILVSGTTIHHCQTGTKTSSWTLVCPWHLLSHHHQANSIYHQVTSTSGPISPALSSWPWPKLLPDWSPCLQCCLPLIHPYSSQCDLLRAKIWSCHFYSKPLIAICFPVYS